MTVYEREIVCGAKSESRRKNKEEEREKQREKQREKREQAKANALLEHSQTLFHEVGVGRQNGVHAQS